MTNTKRRGRRILSAAILATSISTGGLVAGTAAPAQAMPRVDLCVESYEAASYLSARARETGDIFFTIALLREIRWQYANNC